jgi:hypothetical protein
MKMEESASVPIGSQWDKRQEELERGDSAALEKTGETGKSMLSMNRRVREVK